MKIAILTVWYNEEDLARLFCNHYSFADTIYILLDNTTDDRCAEIAHEFSNVIIKKIDLGGVMDDGRKQRYINDFVALKNDCRKQRYINDFVTLKNNWDWLYSVDADEFIEPKNSEDHWDFLRRQTGNLCYARMYQVYRYRTDVEINQYQMPILQRRYGDPNTTAGMNGRFRKPIVVKRDTAIGWYPGCHQYIDSDDIIECKEEMTGAHWRMADPELAVKRRLKNRDRQGENNLQNGYSFHNHNITAGEVLKQCDFWKENGIRVL